VTTPPAARPAALDKVTAPTVAILESTWAAIRRHHRELPAVAFVIGSGTVNSKNGEWTAGHFAPARWADDLAATDYARHEVFVAGELLKSGPLSVLATLLHEAAHALAHVREVKDTSRGGRYHNTLFRGVAQEVGLTVEQMGKNGWAATALSPETADRYRVALERLAKITSHRKAETRAEATGRKSNNNGVAASCPTCGRKIRMSRSVNEAGPIMCWPCLAEALADGYLELTDLSVLEDLGEFAFTAEGEAE
jgi:hypothetical protein